MKTFIPHVYFSAPEDTVGDLVNQIRRESEIPGTAEPKPEMKDSGKKSIIPKTVVSAPEKDTVGDLIEQLHKEPEPLPEEQPEEKAETPEKTDGKKSIIRTRRFITRRSPPCARNSTTRTCSRILCRTAACTGL